MEDIRALEEQTKRELDEERSKVRISILYTGVYRVPSPPTPPNGRGSFIKSWEIISCFEGNIMAVGKNLMWKKREMGSNIIFPILRLLEVYQVGNRGRGI